MQSYAIRTCWCLLVAAALAAPTAPYIGIMDNYQPAPNVEAVVSDPALMTGYSLTEATRQIMQSASMVSWTVLFQAEKVPTNGTLIRRSTDLFSPLLHVKRHSVFGRVAAGASQVNRAWPSKTRLGSSSTNTKTVSQNQGYFSVDPKINPMMYNWNAVYFK